MRNALRSLWLEPRAPDPPAVRWWDWGLVLVVVMTAFLEGTLREDVVWRPVAILLAIALAFSLLWRRSHPLRVVVFAFGMATAMNLILLAGSESTFGLYSMAFILILPYSLHRWGSGREITIGIGVILTAVIFGIAVDFTDIGEAIAGFVVALSPALIGATVRYRSYARARDRDQAVLREREQLARELHDTVAHHVSAIAIQAQVGRTLADTDSEAPLRSLAVIEEEASRTLTEMRTMVGALRDGEDFELSPIPGVADLSRLAGDSDDQPQVVVDVSGTLDGMTPSVDAAIYRLAQESITNALRHARRATTVQVSVVGEDDVVRMTVRDDGDPVQASDDAGFGLIGMTERAHLLGGSLEAGPASDGGWAVTALLPKDGATR